MSEEAARVRDITHLPIFPLPLVLMPFEVLPLHIFEPKYKEMLEDVSEGTKLFGVSMFDPEASFDGRPEVGSVGCTAEIKESETLPDGRSNILTIGVIRYRITEYLDIGRPYLEAKVEFFEDEPSEDTSELEILGDEVFKLFERAAKASHTLSGQAGELPEIPKAPPEQLSFLVSAAFGLDSGTKQELIECVETRERLERAKRYLNEAVKQVEETAMIDKISRTNGHAKKKIDYGE